MKTALISIFYAIILYLGTNATLVSQDYTGQSISDCVILAYADDPFVTLANSIAEEEGFTIVHDTDAALNLDPEYLIWVASPDRLNESTMMDFGKKLGSRNTSVAVGIISGSTIEHARALWKRKPSIPIDGFAYISLADGIFLDTDMTHYQHDFAASEIQGILQYSDYVHYSGHGSSHGWSNFSSDRIPDNLNPMIVSAASCETFRPFVTDNIALRFTDNGAAAYVGFVWSPVGDYFMGDYGEFPFRYAWPGCSLGHIVQIINQGTLKTFARFPQCFLLGDPRTYLNEKAPYRIERDETTKNNRTILYRDCPKGIVPFRIPDGAMYSYVNATGISAASRDDLFYNSRLQQVDIGSDKFILLQSDGGDVSLTLQTNTPVLWHIQDTISDFLDYVVPVRDDQSILKLIGLFIILPFTVWRSWKQKLPITGLIQAIVVGMVTSFSAWLYAVIRAGSITVSAVAIQTNVIQYVVSALLVTGVVMLFLTMKSWWTKGLVLLWSAFPAIIVPALLPVGIIMKHVRRIPDYAHINIYITLLVAVLVKAVLIYVLISIVSRWKIIQKHTEYSRI